MDPLLFDRNFVLKKSMVTHYPLLLNPPPVRYVLDSLQFPQDEQNKGAGERERENLISDQTIGALPSTFY